MAVTDFRQADLPFIIMHLIHSFTRIIARLAFLCSAGLLTLNAIAADAPTLHEKLEPFRPLLGKTWRGEFKNSTPDKPVVDIARWERALNGQAVRILHSINQGVYGGETLIFWSKEKNSLVYHYFTTAGFQTTGTMTFEGNKFTSLEKVAGEANGVTEVKAVGEIRPDGTLVNSSEYLKNGKWEPGHGATYREDPKAEVIFK
jgi:hypothetical protein